MNRFALIALALLTSLSAFAADAPKPQLYAVHDETANPSMIPQYESVTKGLLKAFNEKNVTSPSFYVTTFMTSDMHYVYVTPIDNFAQLDQVNKDWMDAANIVGADRWAELMKRGNASMVSYDEEVWTQRLDLSYQPENPRISMADHRYYRWQFYYLKPGTEQQAEQIAKDYVALFKEKKIADSYTIFTAVNGHDLPILLVTIPAKSAADFAAAEEKNNAILGDGLKALQARVMAIMRKFEQREAWLRPDLSRFPPTPAAK